MKTWNQASILKDSRTPNFTITAVAIALFACLPLSAETSKSQQMSLAKVESLLEREKYADVVRLGNSLVRGLDSNSEELRRTEYALGIALLKLGKLEEGRKYILHVSKLDSVDDLEKVARSVEAMNAWCEANVFLADSCKMTIAEARNNYEFSAKILRKRGAPALRTLAPPTLRAGYYLACAYVVRGDYSKASAVMRKSGYWLSRGELLQQRNVLDNYLLSYGERKTDCHVFYAPWRGPESLNRGDIIRRSADLLMIRRDFVRAQALYQRLAKTRDLGVNDAQRAWAEMQLARIDAINGDVPGAIKKLAVFLKKKEDCSPYAVLRGGLMIHNTQDDLEEAGRWFRHVYENYPQTPEAVSASYYEAISLHFARRYGPAIEKFEAHLKRYPEAGHATYLREMLLPEVRKLLAHQEEEAQELAEKKMADAAAKAAENKKNGIKSDHTGTASKPRFGEDSTLNRKARKLGDSKK